MLEGVSPLHLTEGLLQQRGLYQNQSRLFNGLRGTIGACSSINSLTLAQYTRYFQHTPAVFNVMIPNQKTKPIVCVTNSASIQLDIRMDSNPGYRHVCILLHMLTRVITLPEPSSTSSTKLGEAHVATS